MADHQAAHRLFLNSRREAVLVLIVNAVALVWTVGYCFLKGYQHAPDSWVVQWGWATPRSAADFHHLGGLPDWVMFGIFLPWLVCALLTILACLVMRDDELGQDVEEGAGHGH